MRVRTKSRSVFVCILVLILTLTVVGTVTAQEGEGDEEEPSGLFEHPVVAAFRSYFGDEVAEEVIVYHGGSAEGEEGGVGYGVLVKMYAMAAESQEACAASEEPCTPVTVEELMAAYQSGTGMGELFKLYGKPAVLGVGHLKDKGGPPEHAGPKDKDGSGPPEHAGPKDKDKGKGKDKD